MLAHDGPLAPQPGGVAWDETLHLVAADGIRLRGALWHGGDRGLALVLAGRTEFLENYQLPAAELLQRGFSVACVDWRGQGLSDRLIEPHLKGHVRSFPDYQLDLDALMAHPEVAAVGGRRVMIANSMGGTVGLRALHEGRHGVDAAVLLAPMMGIHMNPLQLMLRRFLLPAARAAGALDFWPPLLGVSRPYVFNGFRGNVLTSNREMFDWYRQILIDHPRLQMGMPTMRWIDEALKEIAWIRAQGLIPCPSLMLLGTREQVVEPKSTRNHAAELGSELVEIEGGRHDLLDEAEPMYGAVWAAIDGFLKRCNL